MDEDFELQYSGKVNDLVPVYKYLSKKTGLRVVLAQVEGPLVNGYFCLATEAHDDDGLPHTLEHLVFMGSEDYPYKGVLDLIANRCLASGTNAWTDTDHTCYTMTTAGSAGFLKLMPVFLDHVLYPLLTEPAYNTEVHHINGEGEDAGVVYCEMQARENTGESLTHLALLRALYPGCGYKSETGGILNNLRTSTSHQKVCSYHKEFYRPENLYLIVTGMVEPQQLFAPLKAFETKIIAKGPLPPYQRPWQTPVEPLENSVDQRVPYPSDEIDHGMVTVAWRGPPAKDQYSLSAIMILMEYLTDTAIAPLRRDFVEIDEPFCSEVRYHVIENSISCVYVHFENVPVPKLDSIKPKLLEVLRRFAGSQEVIDMTRMHSVVHRRILEALSTMEDCPHDTISFHVIGEFLYGDTNADMEDRLNQVNLFQRLDKEPQKYWVDLVSKFFVDKNTVTVIGEPSVQLMEDMGMAEQQRIEEQRQYLGEEGLKLKEAEIMDSMAKNENEPPQSMVTNVKVPDVGCIRFHNIKPCHNHKGMPAPVIDTSGQLQGGCTGDGVNAVSTSFPLDNVPISFQLDDMRTNFATLVVMMDTGCLTAELKPYLPLYTEVILESPILRNGVFISHEDVIKELAGDTLFNGCALGVGGSRFACGEFGTVATVMVKVELEKYKKGVQWLSELLYQVQFTNERLKIVSKKMLNDVASMKRDGRTVTETLIRELNFNNESPQHTSSMLRQLKFLTGLHETLEKDKDTTEVIDKMQKLQTLLTRPCNMRIHMAANVQKLSAEGNPAEPWIKNFLPTGMSTAGDKPVIPMATKFIFPPNAGPGMAMITGVGSVESSYLLQTVPCVSDFNHPDVPAIMVYIQYLVQMEGPMWKHIRGLGLAYHYSMSLKIEAGLLYFLLFKSAQLVDAYRVAKKIMDDHLDGTSEFSEVELETCKSSLIFQVIDKEKSFADASIQSMLGYFRGTTHGYNRRIIQAIPKVTIADLKRVGALYFSALFDPQKSRVAICCHPSKVEEIYTEFTSMGREMKMVDSLDDPLLTAM